MEITTTVIVLGGIFAVLSIAIGILVATDRPKRNSMD